MIDLSSHRIVVDACCAVPESFNAVAELSQRTIIPEADIIRLLGASLIIEARGRDASQESTLTMIGGRHKIISSPHRRFDHMYELSTSNEGGFILSPHQGPRIVSLPDGRVVGIALSSARSKRDGVVDRVFGVSAERLLNASFPRHIREFLKDKFNPAVLEGKNITEINQFKTSPNYWALEGNLDNPLFLSAGISRRGDDITIDGIRYDECFSIESHARIDKSVPSIYEPRLLTTPDDIGRPVYVWKNCEDPKNPSQAYLVGVVAAMTEHDNTGHNHRCQTTYMVAAPDILVP